MTGLTLAPGVLIEELGSETLIVVPGSPDALVLSGDAAHTLRQICAGRPVESANPSVSHLIQLGIVQAPSGISRRGVLHAGLVGVGAGIVALTMPTVAAASSHVEEPTSGGFAVKYVNYSGGSVTVTQFDLGMERDGSDDTDGWGLTDGQTGQVTLSNGDTYTVTFDESQPWFESDAGLAIDGTDFFDITHTLVFSNGSETFTVEFTPED